MTFENFTKKVVFGCKISALQDSSYTRRRMFRMVSFDAQEKNTLAIFWVLTSSADSDANWGLKDDLRSFYENYEKMFARDARLWEYTKIN